jgi:Ricin-type beta-trefoil lectin domain
MLPSPSSQGWTNVVDEMHEYQYNGSESQVEQGSTNQVNDFNNHASDDCPGYIGEFNDMDNDSGVWNFSTEADNSAGLSWTMWAYKSTNALNPTNWGFYGPTDWADTPNVSNDSAATITADWQQWTTTNAFALNTDLGLSGHVNGASLSTSSWFNVVNLNSGSCVDAQNWGTSNRTVVQQWRCGSQQYNQEWQLESVGHGVYAVSNRNAPSEAWNVTNVGTSDGSPIQLWSYGGGSNEQWMPVSVGNNWYKFVGVGSLRCLDVPGASTSNGVQLDIYDCNGTAAQSFYLDAEP